MARNSKDLLSRVDLITQAWEKRRPGKKFSGLAVRDVKEAVQASRQARQHIKETEGSLQGAKKRCKLLDAELLDLERRVVLAVRGDDEDGEDSELFGEMGFVPRSQRARRARRRTRSPSVGGANGSVTIPTRSPAPGSLPVPTALMATVASPEKVA